MSPKLAELYKVLLK